VSRSTAPGIDDLISRITGRSLPTAGRKLNTVGNVFPCRNRGEVSAKARELGIWLRVRTAEATKRLVDLNRMRRHAAAEKKC
jgi:hypothetical protein